VTITARLTPQKRLTDAVAVFAKVVAEVPDAQLEIFGDGPRQEELEREIVRLGLTGSVHLRGFDPHARDRLWRSSAYVLTSRFEGYPLATLESMSQGCPVVSYDIKYGPREQISDGVDGFLVAEGDVDAAARRVVELLRSPERVREMSAAARAKAEQFGPDACVANWAGVLHSVLDHRPLRTRLRSVDLELEPVRLVRTGPLHRLAALGGDPRAIAVNGLLTVDGSGRRAGLDAVEISLDAVDDDTAEVARLPLKVSREDNTFRVRARAPLSDLPHGGASGAVWLRLRLTWRNSSWETEVARPAALSPLEPRALQRAPG
jgi:poly(glycerol-phosphate) alpha-glucosyltransferase